MLMPLSLWTVSAVNLNPFTCPTPVITELHLIPIDKISCVLILYYIVIVYSVHFITFAVFAVIYKNVFTLVLL